MLIPWLKQKCSGWLILPLALGMTPLSGINAAYALDLPEMPGKPEPVPLAVDACPEDTTVMPGQPLPAWFLDESGNVACRASIVAPSVLKNYRLVATWGVHYREAANVVIESQRLELEYYRELPRPKPELIRWASRGEMLLIQGALI